jgi:hypothetical protein
MEKWFGPNIVKKETFYDKQTLISPLFATNATSVYGNYRVASGASLIQPGIVPASNLMLSFTTWEELANSAGMSRLYGGIHCITAHDGSQQVAREVNTIINQRWDIQTSPA